MRGCPEARVTGVVALPAPNGLAALLRQLATAVEVLGACALGEPTAPERARTLLAEPDGGTDGR